MAWTPILAGIVGTFPLSRTTSEAVGACHVLLTFVYDLTLGLVCHVVVAGVDTDRVQVLSVAENVIESWIAMETYTTYTRYPTSRPSTLGAFVGTFTLEQPTVSHSQPHQRKRSRHT